MNKEEFCKLATLDPETFSDADFDKINAVYLDHPSIKDVDGKQQIASIFTFGGMPTIDDMYKRVTEINNTKKAIASISKDVEMANKRRDKELEEVSKRHNAAINILRITLNKLEDLLKDLTK